MAVRYKRLLITGGAGFVGSSFVRYALQQSATQRVINFDLLTYAADLSSVEEVKSDGRYAFVQGDIVDGALVERICKEEAIDAIVHFAAESHVDRSIAEPAPFYRTNVEGTLQLLEVVRRHPEIHFHHISTDEVYGALPKEGHFTEESRYSPSSPYSASKAASDHFVRAYAHTYGLKMTLSHCTNNYGPYQHREKFIPTIISQAVQKQPIPLYGSGEQIRDWIFVEDHAAAVWRILQAGRMGEVYDIGGECEKENREVARSVLEQLALVLEEPVETYLSLLTQVKDRPGHDFRYAIDCTKIKSELGWHPTYPWERGLQETLSWYLRKTEKAGLS